MELRIKRVKPGVFSIHSETGDILENVRHLETRYEGDQVLTTVEITTRAELVGKFQKPKTEHAKEPKRGSESKPA